MPVHPKTNCISNIRYVGTLIVQSQQGTLQDLTLAKYKTITFLTNRSNIPVELKINCRFNR